MGNTLQHVLPLLFDAMPEIDTEVDLSPLARRFRNDATGAPAYVPAVMPKTVLLAYSRGVVSSRLIERLYRENVLFSTSAMRTGQTLITADAGYHSEADLKGLTVRARGTDAHCRWPHAPA